MTDQNPYQKRTILKIIAGISGLAVISMLLMVAVSFIDFIYYQEITKVFTQPSAVISQKAETPKIILPQVLYNLAGPIKLLDKNFLVLEAAIPQLNELNQVVQKIENRKVLVGPATRFSRLIFISQGEGAGTPKETSITFKDLKINDYIEAVSNKDISQAPEFEATQIRVLPR